MNEFTPEWINKCRRIIGYIDKNYIKLDAYKISFLCLDEIERVQSRVQELEAEQRWIPVSERLPECGEIVNWSHKSWTRIKEGYMTGSGILKVWGGEYQKLDKMNWRPLPQPPKDVE